MSMEIAGLAVIVTGGASGLGGTTARHLAALGAKVTKLNIPGEDEYVAAYCVHTGRDGIANLNFYVAFNMFRLAASFHGIKARWKRGSAASPHAKELVAALPFVVQRAWEQSQGALS
jgi:aminoglycoside phosphotransferase (APT) family kinase protein